MVHGNKMLGKKARLVVNVQTHPKCAGWGLRLFDLGIVAREHSHFERQFQKPLPQTHILRFPIV